MADLSAGAAKVDITPKTPAYLAGYRSRDKPFEDVHDPLFVRTLVLDDGREAIGLISCDLCSLSTELHEELREATGYGGGEGQLARQRISSSLSTRS